MEFRVLKEYELKQWTAFCGSVFPVGEAYFMRHYVNDPCKDINGIFVAVENGEIKSSVRVFTRELLIRDKCIRIGGIGEVCTAVTHRGQGLSGTLLEMAIGYMDNHDMPLSMLGTGTNHHYSRYGWFTVPSYFKVYSLPECELPKGYEIRKMTGDDFESIKRLWRTYAHVLCPVYKRTDEYYDMWVKNELKTTYVLIKDGVAVSYADCTKHDKEGIFVREYIGGENMDMMKPFLYQISVKEGWYPFAGISSPFACDPVFSTIYDNSQMFRINRPFELEGKTIRHEEHLRPFLNEFAELSVDSY
jgi:predicted GNAT family N-acyltransferase